MCIIYLSLYAVYKWRINNAAINLERSMKFRQRNFSGVEFFYLYNHSITFKKNGNV